jgi:hypothetical protein
MAYKNEWGILLEYPIPRRAKRIDAVVIANNIVFVIEFKDNESEYKKAYIRQLEDYCLDLRDFHLESQNAAIIPIHLCPVAAEKVNNYTGDLDGMYDVLYSNQNNLHAVIEEAFRRIKDRNKIIDFRSWNQSKYSPTPTIVEAAQVLYAGQDVKEISRSYAEENLTVTTSAVIEAIKEAQATNSKIICFITGVPGAGKTLAGLNIVHNSDFKKDAKDLGVFLSGNSPLVKVLSEALARDTSRREGINKKEASRKVSTFIQNVHQFIDAYFEDKTSLPVDNVLIYDEAQRAWTKEYKYFKSNKRINASEPEILMSIMDRFKDSWAVIIALVGGGQEINTGEGGLSEWGKAIRENFSHWKIYISPELKVGDHSTGNMTLFNQVPANIQLVEKPALHLRIPLRSYKAQELSNWVNLVLSNNPIEAKNVYESFSNAYTISITRSLDIAKAYFRKNVKGSRRYGLLASSGARRLRAIGVDVNAGLKGTSTQNELGAWYLNPEDDVRSSNFLEIVSSEFGVQGLELDWTCVCWDLDLRRHQNDWEFKNFSGTKWQNIKVENVSERQYLINTYRVLLTRAREGMVILVPKGDKEDDTRLPHFYDSVFSYLKSCGVNEL